MEISRFKKKIILFIDVLVLLFASNALFANNELERIRELREELKTATQDSVYINACNALAYHYGMINLDSSVYFLTLGKQKAIAAKYSRGLAINYSFFARVNIEQSHYEKAIANFDSAIFIFEALHDTTELIDCYLGKSYIYSTQSHRIAALDYNQKALPLAMALQDSVKLSLIYNNIASFYYYLGDLEKTYTYFRKSLDIEETMSPQSRDIALSYSNLAMVLVKMKQYEDAKLLYDKMQGILPQIDNDYIKTVVYLSFSYYYIANKASSKAKQYLDKAEVLLKKSNFKQLEARWSKRLGQWHMLEENYEDCIRCLNQSIAIQEGANINEGKDEIFDLMAQAFHRKGDNLQAFQQMQHFKEEVEQSERKKIILFLAEFEEHRMQNELNQKRLGEVIKTQKLEQSEAQMRFKYYLAIFIIVILIYSVILASYHWHKTRTESLLLSEKNKVIQSQKQELKTQLTFIKKNEEKLIDANATKDKFLSIIAHDLRSPFSSLIGFSELLIEQIEANDNQKSLRYAKLINEVANYSFALLNNLLEWALEKVGKMEFQPQKIPLNAFVKERIQHFRILAPEHNIVFESTVADNDVLNIDSKMMDSVFRNLISNAIKYTPPQGQIRVSIKQENSSIHFSVKDTGIGMSQEQQKHLFKIDEAESTPGLNNEKGTGLGLILCKDFVEKHQGQIGVESQEGQGTIFYFQLPKV